MKWLSNYRKRKEADITGPQEMIREARAASARSEVRSDYIDIVATRMEKRIDQNHFAESLAQAWAPRKERHA